MADKVVGQVSSDKTGTNDNNPPPFSWVDVINGKPPSSKPLENTTDWQGTGPPDSVKNSMRLYRSTETKAPVTNTDTGKSQSEAIPRSNASEIVKNGPTHSVDSKLSKSADKSIELGNQRFIYDKKSWVNEVTTQTMTTSIGVAALRLPRVAGFNSMLLGTASGARDIPHLLNANTALEQFKYGSASVADASLFSGGTLLLLQKAPKLGPSLVGAGIAGRFLADLVPNRIESLFDR